MSYIFMAYYLNLMYSFEVNIEFYAKKTHLIPIGTILSAALNVILYNLYSKIRICSCSNHYGNLEFFLVLLSFFGSQLFDKDIWHEISFSFFSICNRFYNCVYISSKLLISKSWYSNFGNPLSVS